jgi:hypothetical protein
MNAGSMALEFMLGGELWRCEMQAEWDWGRASDYDCSSRGAFDRPEAQTRDTRARVSPDGNWEAFIESYDVVVRRVGTVPFTALSTDGTPMFGYQGGSITWSADSKRISAYRVSSALSTADSNVRQFVVRGEWPVAR